ncbi:polyprenyl synthetase family protein [Faecalicoccus pleomorphus]|uniref:Farnesyl diphosphate synthase n=1 Tax=Faecalicoccus pleomorphus TaxID=1323 RepID=A0A380LKE3_9FIRM|nr:farnesyl diphosphate synthase [Faecalicoccus pleomorphus]MBM6807939.1 polyprenyl synthetase family protein [Faecalicoccus pleomorphus]SUO03685.1 Octaprenyl diphosphate synthase / Dimethylallyltransferase / (2E,6E)-farnesyl diphosphate synthase/ Geranylgeranyl diphosphate synthase [Faecalicoccus pleomorphus]
MNNKDFEDYLRQQATVGLPSRTKEAMTYSLMNGGKRIRPLILFSLLKDYGFKEQLGYPCGCAIEMIHTYSLIHDDLPCMDDDDLRRGKPSCHKAYDEATAVLAGDALLTRAFQVVLESQCSSEKKCALVSNLTEYSGIDGMIYGQDLDMKAETLTDAHFEDLQEIEVYKTAKLLTLPMVCAAILADKEQDIPVLKEIGVHLGIQFQVQDDILDVTSSATALGKSTSDTQNNKLTAVSLLGLEESQNLVAKLDQQIQSLLNDLSTSTSSFQKILDFLIHRTC